jgi:hypothetical protein
VFPPVSAPVHTPGAVSGDDSTAVAAAAVEVGAVAADILVGEGVHDTYCMNIAEVEAEDTLHKDVVRYDDLAVVPKLLPKVVARAAAADKPNTFGDGAQSEVHEVQSMYVVVVEDDSNLREFEQVELVEIEVGSKEKQWRGDWDPKATLTHYPTLTVAKSVLAPAVTVGGRSA